MTPRTRRGLRAMVVAVVLAAAGGRPAASQETIDPAVRALAGRLSPARKVGQLFLVPFYGADAGDGTAIARLVDTYGVAGVVLDPSHGNFANAADAPRRVAELANALQARATAPTGPGVPLFVALAQGGDADTPLRGGMTSLPSQMALGATWQPEHAERVGELVGRELAAVGVNLLLGPSLDVLAVPRPATSGDLGVGSYGGSPAWVGLFGRRMIAGVKRGSAGRVATAAGRFPGIGGADRSQAEEVAVVESTLDQLVALDLAPFVAVTDGGDPEGVTDALVTSHVRYRGIQQQTDRPLSLDSGGLRYLWAQVPALDAWRNARSGVLVSAGLGLPSVRRYVDPDLQTFNARRVVREALTAGNDLLTLTSFGPGGDPAAEMASLEEAIAWLAGEYEADETVREAVDAALLRVLTLKQRLYGDLRTARVAVDAEAAPSQTGLGGEIVAQVAREALTRVAAVDAPAAAPGPSPGPGDRLLFVVDARVVSPCPGCPPEPSPDPQALPAIVRRTYGPEGTGRVQDDADVAAITFAELKAWLQATGSVAPEDTVVLEAPLPAARLAEVDALVAGADWMVFAMGDLRPAEAPASDAVKLYLKASARETADRRLVAIALGAPYYLDTTEIAKLSAYYAVYAQAEPFLEVAVRALFGDVPATGASPVSVPGAGYSLEARLQPDPDQAVDLELVGRDPEAAIERQASFTVRTGTIRDENGNIVPDGTRVTFRRLDRADGVYLPDVVGGTAGGQATASMRAERGGELEIVAVLDNGLRAEPLVARIDGGLIGPFAPPVGLADALARPRVAVDWDILLLSLSLMLLAGVLTYGVDAEAAASPGRLVRLFLLSLAWGLAGYLLVAAGGLQLGALPGGARLWPGAWSVAYQAPMLSFLFALLPVVPSLARALRAGDRPAPTDRTEAPQR